MKHYAGYVIGRPDHTAGKASAVRFGRTVQVLCFAGVLPAMRLLGASQAGRLTAPTPAPERLVAEAVIRAPAHGTDHVYLPVTLHGQAVTVVLDLGADVGVYLSAETLAHAGLSLADDTLLDSLTLGTTIEHHIDLQSVHHFSMAAPPGLPPVIGLLGTHVLSHYDLVFDGPAHRVRLYAPSPPGSPASPDARVAWLPPGLTAADCTPLRHEYDTFVGLDLRADGHPMFSYFDSGSQTTDMNLAAAHLLGLTQHSPNVHRLPDSLATSYVTGVTEKYTVTEIPLTIGTHALTALSIRIVSDIPLGLSPETPILALGLDAFRDRVLVVSYSTNHVCLGASS